MHKQRNKTKLQNSTYGHYQAKFLCNLSILEFAFKQLGAFKYSRQPQIRSKININMPKHLMKVAPNSILIFKLGA